jgi:hypothetical protein
MGKRLKEILPKNYTREKSEARNPKLETNPRTQNTDDPDAPARPTALEIGERGRSLHAEVSGRTPVLRIAGAELGEPDAQRSGPSVP